MRGSPTGRRAQPLAGRRLPASPTLLIGAITVIALALRLPSFHDSLFGDEVGAYYVVTGHGLGRTLYLLKGHSPELNPPLWFIVAWLSEKLFGISPESLKLPSLVLGTATVPLTYVLGRLAINVRAGLAGAAIVAFSPFMIFYSTEARPYALMVFLCLVSTLALVQACRSDRPLRWWVLYAVAACGAVYTHFTSVFLLAAQFGWVLLARPRARRGLALATLAAGIGFLPWLPQLIATAHSPGTKIYDILEPFGLSSIRYDLGHWAIGHPFFTLAQVPGQTAGLLILAGLAVGAVGGALRFLRSSEWRQRISTRRGGCCRLRRRLSGSSRLPCRSVSPCTARCTGASGARAT